MFYSPRRGAATLETQSGVNHDGAKPPLITPSTRICGRVPQTRHGDVVCTPRILSLCLRTEWMEILRSVARALRLYPTIHLLFRQLRLPGGRVFYYIYVPFDVKGIDKSSTVHRERENQSQLIGTVSRGAPVITVVIMNEFKAVNAL